MTEETKGKTLVSKPEEKLTRRQAIRRIAAAAATIAAAGALTACVETPTYTYTSISHAPPASKEPTYGSYQSWVTAPGAAKTTYTSFA